MPPVAQFRNFSEVMDRIKSLNALWRAGRNECFIFLHDGSVGEDVNAMIVFMGETLAEKDEPSLAIAWVTVNKQFAGRKVFTLNTDALFAMATKLRAKTGQLKVQLDDDYSENSIHAGYFSISSADFATPVGENDYEITTSWDIDVYHPLSAVEDYDPQDPSARIKGAQWVSKEHLEEEAAWLARWAPWSPDFFLRGSHLVTVKLSREDSLLMKSMGKEIAESGVFEPHQILFTPDFMSMQLWMNANKGKNPLFYFPFRNEKKSHYLANTGIILPSINRLLTKTNIKWFDMELSVIRAHEKDYLAFAGAFKDDLLFMLVE